MKTDEILAAIANIRQRMMRVDGAYSATQVRSRMRLLNWMRSYVLDDDAENFTNFCQKSLETVSGDAMVDILDDLYEELDLPNDTVWETFEQQFLTSV